FPLEKVHRVPRGIRDSPLIPWGAGDPESVRESRHFRKQQTAFFTEDNKRNEGLPEFQSPSALCPLLLSFPSLRSGRFVKNFAKLPGSALLSFCRSRELSPRIGAQEFPPHISWRAQPEPGRNLNQACV